MTKLSWSEIKERYDQQWVHLVDYEWEEGEPYPTAGVVHLHARTRKEFDRVMLSSEPISGARIYVGDIRLPPNQLRMGCFVVAPS